MVGVRQRRDGGGVPYPTLQGIGRRGSMELVGEEDGDERRRRGAVRRRCGGASGIDNREDDGDGVDERRGALTGGVRGDGEWHRGGFIPDPVLD